MEPAMNSKLPAVVVASIVSLALGGGLCVLGMTLFGYQLPSAGASSVAQAGQAAAPKGAAPKAGAAGGEKGKKGKGGFNNSRTQLAQLVTKLDVLTGKPLHLELPAETQAKVADQLQGLGGDEELADDTAKRKLESLLELVKDHKETLEAAGFRGPDSGGGRFIAPTAGNPFSDDKTGKHLKDLQERLQKGMKN